jgi:septum formation protein
MRQIILASQSPQRRDLLQTLNIPFEIIPADIDEKAITNPDLSKRAALIAAAKARKVAELHPNAIIIAGDTYIIDGNQALEKPETLDEARQMLRQQSGRMTTEVTGVCYLDKKNGIEHSSVVEAKTWFRQLSEAEIERFVTTEPVLTWSAAFCPAYLTSMALIDKIEGSFTSFTHGLPLEVIVPLLRQSGISV